MLSLGMIFPTDKEARDLEITGSVFCIYHTLEDLFILFLLHLILAKDACEIKDLIR